MFVHFVPSLMIQESGNRGSSGPVSVSAADIIAVSSSGTVRTTGKVQKSTKTNHGSWEFASLSIIAAVLE